MTGILEEFELEPHHLRLLELAGQAWDRCQEARRVLATDGAVVTDRWGQKKTHPACAIERDSMGSFARLMRELNLDVAPPDARPPVIPGRYR